MNGKAWMIRLVGDKWTLDKREYANDDEVRQGYGGGVISVYHPMRRDGIISCLWHFPKLKNVENTARQVISFFESHDLVRDLEIEWYNEPQPFASNWRELARLMKVLQIIRYDDDEPRAWVFQTRESILISKKHYSSWWELQDDYDDFVTSGGTPGTIDEIVKSAHDEYPSITEQEREAYRQMVVDFFESDDVVRELPY